MAESITIDDQSYLKRNPLGVLGLSILTLSIYFFYWYYKVNQEIQRFENDPTMSPVRSLMALIFGWLIIVPPYIAMYNTAKHVQEIESRRGVQPQLEPALVVVFMLFVPVGNGVYIQEHLNRVWDRAGGSVPPSPSLPPLPPMPQLPSD